MSDVNRDEFRVLRAVLTNQFHSEPPGEARIGSAVFCASLDTSGEACDVKDRNALSALISSLVHKKLVVSDGETIALTSDGYAAATGAM
jgi:hypothetical protein